MFDHARNIHDYDYADSYDSEYRLISIRYLVQQEINLNSNVKSKSCHAE